MSRFFNGGVQKDQILFTAGNAPWNQGGVTIASLVKLNQASFTGHIINGYDAGGFSKFGQLVVASGGNSNLYIENDFGNGGVVAGTEWCWLISVHAAGGAAPEYYKLDLTTGTWSHVTGNAGVTDLGGTATTVVVGNTTGGGPGDSFRGWIRAIALWRRTMDFAEIQQVFTHKAWDFYMANPSWAILLNQTNLSTPVRDLTGNLGNQTSISGTTIDVNVEPPGWDDTIPETLFSDSDTVLAHEFSESQPITLATTFKPLVLGKVYGGRFRTGTIVGSGTYQLVLWEATLEDGNGVGTPTGTIIASVFFDLAKMTPSSWNWAGFATPPSVDPAKMYRMGIRSSEGRYSATNYYFIDDAGTPAPAGQTVGGLTTAHLHAPYATEFFPGLGSFWNGVYDSDPAMQNYPAQSYHGSLYFIDPGFKPDSTITPSGPLIRIWNGSAEVPATLKIWNGTAEVEASVSIT